jgi:hypothetical protein
VRDAASAHPEVSKLRTQHVWTPAMLRVAERWVGIWQQSDLPLERATEAATVSSLAIYGYVDAEVRAREIEWPGDEMLAWLPNARLLYRSRHEPDVAFELVVRALINGLYAQLGPDGRGADVPVGTARRR